MTPQSLATLANRKQQNLSPTTSGGQGLVDVAKYVKGCDLCNQMKTFPAPPVRKLMPNQVLDHGWKIILVNLIMELP